MNAKEARKQSILNAEPQIERLKKQIKEAVEKGESDITFDEVLLKGTEIWVTDNGYTYEEFEATFTIIEW